MLHGLLAFSKTSFFWSVEKASANAILCLNTVWGLCWYNLLQWQERKTKGSLQGVGLVASLGVLFVENVWWLKQLKRPPAGSQVFHLICLDFSRDAEHPRTSLTRKRWLKRLKWLNSKGQRSQRPEKFVTETLGLQRLLFYGVYRKNHSFNSLGNIGEEKLCGLSCASPLHGLKSGGDKPKRPSGRNLTWTTFHVRNERSSESSAMRCYALSVM